MEVLMLCCIMKTLISWHNEETATTCRERCGGQGYLSANRLGESIWGAHAGLTAEGDNRVLMQKVAKELLAMADKKELMKDVAISYLPGVARRVVDGVQSSEIEDRDVQLKLLQTRERILLAELASRLQSAKKKGESLYDTWMAQESDFIQGSRKLTQSGSSWSDVSRSRCLRSGSARWSPRFVRSLQLMQSKRTSVGFAATRS